jgi:hypothetical protein
LLRYARNDDEHTSREAANVRLVKYRSPDERSDIRVERGTGPGYRFAHPGYSYREPNRSAAQAYKLPATGC